VDGHVRDELKAGLRLTTRSTVENSFRLVAACSASNAASSFRDIRSRSRSSSFELDCAAVPPIRPRRRYLERVPATALREFQIDRVGELRKYVN